MTVFVIVAVLFILLGFVLGFFLTSRVASKNQGQMKHCQNCQYFRTWNPYYPCDYSDPDSECAGMTDEQYKEFLDKMREEG